MVLRQKMEFSVLFVKNVWVVNARPGRWNGIIEGRIDLIHRAIRKAFQAIAIELRKFRDKRAKKEVRTAPIPPLRGVVCKLFPRQQYGFILNEGGGEVYFHKNALKGLSFGDLEDGTEVVFNMEEGQKGPQATAVLPVPVVKA